MQSHTFIVLCDVFNAMSEDEERLRRFVFVFKNLINNFTHRWTAYSDD